MDCQLLELSTEIEVHHIRPVSEIALLVEVILTVIAAGREICIRSARGFPSVLGTWPVYIALRIAFGLGHQVAVGCLDAGIGRVFKPYYSIALAAVVCICMRERYLYDRYSGYIERGDPFVQCRLSVNIESQLASCCVDAGADFRIVRKGDVLSAEEDGGIYLICVVFAGLPGSASENYGAGQGDDFRGSFRMVDGKAVGLVEENLLVTLHGYSELDVREVLRNHKEYIFACRPCEETVRIAGAFDFGPCRRL